MNDNAEYTTRSTPLMAVLFKGLIKSRRKQMSTVDLRVRLLSEILNSIRQIKLYAYESYFMQRVMTYREQEIKRLKANVRHRATMVSTMTFLPVAAAVLTFVTYALSGHTLEPAIIFSALQVFSLIVSQCTWSGGSTTDFVSSKHHFASFLWLSLL
jgi:ATP-binding cassette subfamily C (CFTR/MRP) protein 1